jgi:hypothetical protein
MGVISLYFVDYVVEVLYANLSSSALLIVSSSIGCVPSAPDGSSPRGYVWILVTKHRLKVQFFFLLLSSTVCQPPSPSRGFHIMRPQSPLLVLSLWYYRLLCAEFNFCCKICLRALLNHGGPIIRAYK